MSIVQRLIVVVEILHIRKLLTSTIFKWFFCFAHFQIKENGKEFRLWKTNLFYPVFQNGESISFLEKGIGNSFIISEWSKCYFHFVILQISSDFPICITGIPSYERIYAVELVLKERNIDYFIHSCTSRSTIRSILYSVCLHIAVLIFLIHNM